MNRLIQNLKCTLSNKQTLSSYYAELSFEKLIERKRNLWQSYVVLILVWVLSFSIIALAAEVDFPIMLILLVTIGGSIVSLISDYSQRIKLIEREINKFE